MTRELSFAVLALACAGCTTSNTVVLSRLETNYPVSGSSQYIDAQGAFVTRSGYRVVKHFEFTRDVEGPRHEETETRLRLEPELDALVARSSGSAVTSLAVNVDDYDNGSHDSAAGFKMWGLVLGVPGVGLLIAGAASSSPGTKRACLASGGLLTGVGALLYTLGLVSNTPSRWRMHVSGDVVQATGIGPQMGATPRMPSPELPEGVSP
jgi:hypothetical protein